MAVSPMTRCRTYSQHLDLDDKREETSFSQGQEIIQSSLQAYLSFLGATTPHFGIALALVKLEGMWEGRRPTAVRRKPVIKLKPECMLRYMLYDHLE